MFVRSLMTRDVMVARPDMSLQDVARLLAANRIGGVPVVDENDVVVGVVSESDFVRMEIGRLDVPRSRVNRLLGRADPDAAAATARTAGEAMTAPPITIEEGASIRSAATLMAARSINRLPVTQSGRLVGIITRGDIVRVFAQPDDEIAERLRAALRDVDGLVVEDVEGGIAVLAGTVDTRELARAATRLAETTEGVVGVNDERIRWRRDETNRDITPPWT